MPKTPSTTGSKTAQRTSPTTTADPGAPAPDALAALTATQRAVLQRLSETAGMSPGEMAAAENIGLSTARKALAALETAGLARREPGVRDGAQKSPDQWFPAAPGTDAAPEPAQATPQTTDDATADDAVNEEGESQPDPDGVSAEPADFTAEQAATDTADQEPDTPQDAAAENLGDSTDPGDSDADDAAPDESDADSAAEQTDMVADLTGAPDAVPTTSDATSTEKADAATNQDADTAGSPPAPPAAPAALDTASGPRLGKGELRMMVERYLREHPDQAWTPSKIAKALGRSAGAVNNAAVKLVEDGTALTFEDAPHRFQIVPAPADTGTPRSATAAPKTAA